jgi:pimeloyl-ACP methyl ester carboxylesterase
VKEQGFISIGSIDQRISIQGSDAKNPAILFLRGGPAEAQSPFLKEFAPWEQVFTVINWDQRCSGKTYGKNGASTPGVTMDRMAQDVILIVEHDCKRLRMPKLILVGHSWGAMLGFHAVKLKPGGCFRSCWHEPSGQLDAIASGQGTLGVENATAEGDEETLKLLDETATLPVDDMKRIMASNKWRMSPSDNEYLKTQSAFVGMPPFPTIGDVADWVAGGSFTMSKLTPVVFSFDARSLGLDIPLPFSVIQGRDDYIVSFDDARDYVEDIRAPVKAFNSHSRRPLCLLHQSTGIYRRPSQARHAICKTLRWRALHFCLGLSRPS